FYMGDTDEIFEHGDKAILYVELDGGAPAYARILIELKPPVGAPLTVERVVPPNLADQVVVLG
ncbi:MAG: flagellin, partial [Desulfurococcales archaeon ex4484_217_2]